MGNYVKRLIAAAAVADVACATGVASATAAAARNKDYKYNNPETAVVATTITEHILHLLFCLRSKQGRRGVASALCLRSLHFYHTRNLLFGY